MIDTSVHIRTAVTHETILRLWKSRARQVADEIMLTTIRMEAASGLQKPGLEDDLFDATATRFEESLFKKRMKPKWSEWLISIGYSDVLGTARDPLLFTSFGVYQIMGFNLLIHFDEFLDLHEQACRGTNLEDYLLLQMEVYDEFMGKLLKSNDIQTSFRRYNGSDERAYAYAEKAIEIYNTIIEATP